MRNQKLNIYFKEHKMFVKYCLIALLQNKKYGEFSLLIGFKQYCFWKYNYRFSFLILIISAAMLMAISVGVRLFIAIPIGE